MPDSLDGLTVDQRIHKLHRMVLDLTLEVDGKPEKQIPGLRDRVHEVEKEVSTLEVQFREAHFDQVKGMLSWYHDNIETFRQIPITVREFNKMKWTLYGILITLSALLTLSGANLGLQFLKGTTGIP